MQRIIIAIVMCINTIAYSQPNRDTVKNETFGFFYLFPIEIPRINNDQVNIMLKNNELPPALHPAAAIGAGVQWEINRIIFTINYNRTKKTQKTDTTRTQVAYKCWGFNVGYDLIRHPYFSICPYGGFKFCGTNYLYRKIAPDSPSFANYLVPTLDYKDMRSQRSYFDIGVSLSHQWFYLIGIRAGVLLPLEKESWFVNKVELSNSPQTTYSGYITITIGIGSVDNEMINFRRRNRESPTSPLTQ